MKNLLLIHGAIGAADHLQPLADKLRPDFQVHVLELDGHGTKSHIEVSFSLAYFKNQLREKLDEIGAPTHLFGYSMGGFLALLVAAEGYSNIQSVFTLGTKMKWSPEIAAKESAMLNPEKIEEKVPAFAFALAQRHGTEHWKKVLRNTTSLMREIGDIQPIKREVITAINCPIHLCLADDDTMVTEKETREVESWGKAASFSVLPNSQHPIEKVDVEKLAAKIKSFADLV